MVQHFNKTKRTTFKSRADEIFGTLLVIKKLDNVKNQSIRVKTGAQNTVKEIKQNQQK
jgi:hypothetical protein